MALPVERRLTVAEYLAAERQHPDTKCEYLAGVVVAMAGGTRLHSLLGTRIAAALSTALGGRGCEVHGSDLRVRIPARDLGTYPDVTVVCGPFEGDADDPDAATNPIAIVEVLSPTTEAWDRGEKFAAYRALPSLRHYVLVSQDRQHIEHYQRDDDGRWVLTDAGPGGAIELLGATLRVAEVYAGSGVDPAAPPRRTPSPS
jgi:Uma2 family endonuclease